MRYETFAATLLAFVATAGAQTPSDPFAEDAIRETLTSLASDAMLGRNTPSPELELAAELLAKRFEAAGSTDPARAARLKGLGEDGSFFVEYSLAAIELDSTATEVVVQGSDGDVPLRPDADARLWRGGAAVERDGVAVETFGEGDSVDEAGFETRLRPSGKEPVVVVVGEDSPLWRAAAGKRAVLSRGRGGNAVVLVRRGALPEGARVAVSLKCRIRVPESKPIQAAVKNVAAVLRGATRPDEYVVYSAHYDHIGVRPPKNGDGICNGADDDASGTTAVVHLAEAFAALEGVERPGRSIAFVLFSGEEKGLLGSKAFCEKPPLPLDSVVANLNVEMIGRPPEGGRFTAWFTGREYSDLESIAQDAFARAEVKLVAFEKQEQLFTASDNASFARKGVVAHSLSAGSLHEDYHQPGDEVAKIDVEHLSRVARALFELGRDLASREARPAYNAAGRAKLKLPD